MSAARRLSEDKPKKIRSRGEAKSVQGSKARWLLATIASPSFPGLAAVGAIVARRRLLSRPLQPVRSGELLREDGARASARGSFRPPEASLPAAGGGLFLRLVGLVPRPVLPRLAVPAARAARRPGGAVVPVSVTRALSLMDETFRGSACSTG